MALRFRNVDRQTPMFLPPDLRDWVQEDDLVHFIIEAVERLPLETFRFNRRGCGDAQYPPHMMLALLIYCYANGIFSSRRIEQATHRDVAVRYLCGNEHPDHDTICKFRRENFEAVAAAFVDMLELAAAMKLLQIGTVSVDGTHIRANASKDKNVTYERAQQLRQQLEGDVKELMGKAEQSDQEPNPGQNLPKELKRREKLKEKMDQACRRLEESARVRAQAQQAEYERKVAERSGREGKAKGRHIKPPDPTPEPGEQVNLSDADSKLMRKNKREGYTQSYNAQAVVDAEGSQLIVGQRLSVCASDAGELEEDLKSIPSSLGQPKAALADCGYVDKKAFERIERQIPGLELYVSVHREDAHEERRYEFRPPKRMKQPKRIVDPALVAMAEKLKTEPGRQIYRKRAQTVEPVFGVIKAAMGFRQFLLRGLEKVRGEWSLACLAYNFKRLHNLKMALAAG